MSVIDAVIDAVDAKAGLVEGVANRVAAHLKDDVAAVVAVAARAGATRAMVAEAIRKRRIPRLELVAMVETLHHAGSLAERIAASHEKAVAAAGRAKRRGPLRRPDLEERRARRGRTDRIEEEDLDALPPIDELAGLSDDALRSILRDNGVAWNEDEALATQIERVSSRLIGAERPDDALVERVIRSALSRTRTRLLGAAKGVVRDITTARSFRGRPPEAPMIWIALLDTTPGHETCSSCEDRHNDSAPMSEWRERGLPGSANLLCGDQCRCELLPDDLFDPELRQGEGGISVELNLTTTREPAPGEV